jgi:hypothetical protein
LAIRVALAAQQSRRLLALITVSAIAFRGTLLFSDPIEEIDLYRYLWDGQVVIAGGNPFQYSPRQVLSADRTERLPPELARLVDIQDRSRETAQILDRIHYGELPTIYPPTSQAVFAVAALCTPQSASLATRMIIMKAWFVGFDLATLWLVVLLLRWAEKPIGWSIAYAWCPLLLKEIANSGHLDALAVFLATLSLYLAVRALFPRKPTADISPPSSARSGLLICTAAAILTLAVGAKLYPLVLLPLLWVTTLCRLGWRKAIATGCISVLGTAIVLWPMVPKQNLAELPPVRISATADDLPPLPPPELGISARDPSQSLRAFLSEWEMNDFLFLLVMENVRPTDQLPREEVAWFSVVSESWRQSICGRVAEQSGVEPGRAPFFITRAATSLAFMITAFWLAVRPATRGDAEGYLEAAFLTLAWFWLLLPTQNPWYWTWALPLLPFARGRAWIALSGLALLYYFRFWLAAHFLNAPVFGTNYRGPQFFDYVVTCFEYGPWLLGLATAAWLRRREPRGQNA